MLRRKRVIIIFSVLAICLAVIFGLLLYGNASIRPDSNRVSSKSETILEGEYKKQSMTELAVTLTYDNNTNKESKIYYRILKTTFYEGDPAEVTGLHTEALEVLFPVELMDSCEKMKIQNWDAAIYKKDDVAFLCWTYSPEVSYVLEYNPSLINDSEMIKMAESVRPIE